MTTLDQQILQAASDLLRDVGADFTMDQLVERAKVPRATIYRRIGSKDVLLQRLVQEKGIVLSQPHTTRTRILHAARVVFARFGLANATIEQIAAEAGAGVATVYRHFGDKDHIIWAFVEELSPRPFVRELAKPTQDVAADLSTLAATLLPFFYEYRDILHMILTANDAERAYIEHLRTDSDRTLDQLATYFAAQVAAGRLRDTERPRELALAFLGLLFAYGVIGPLHYGTTLESPDRIADMIGRLFVGGLQQPEIAKGDRHESQQKRSSRQKSRK